MRFERKTIRSTALYLKEGNHDVTITKVEKTNSKKGSPMFKFTLENQEQEKGYYYLVFGTDYTEENFQFLLTSIEDHGVDIPDLDFGYNDETVAFLENKPIYVEVVAESEGNQQRYRVSSVLTLSEFEDSEENPFSDY